MLTTGLVSITFRALSPPEIVRLVREASLDTIEWGGDVHVPPGDVRRAQEIARLTTDAGLSVAAYGSYYRAGPSEGDSPPFARVLETALALGAPVVRVWAGTVGSGDAGEAVRRAVTDDLRRAAALAAEARVQIALEFHGGTLSDTPDAALRLLGDIGHPHLKTLWQPAVGASPAERLAGLRRLLPHLAHIHAFQWAADGARLPLADGEAEWHEYLSLAARDNNHPVLLEYVPGDSPEAFRRDAGTLRRWAAGTVFTE